MRSDRARGQTGAAEGEPPVVREALSFYGLVIAALCCSTCTDKPTVGATDPIEGQTAGAEVAAPDPAAGPDDSAQGAAAAPLEPVEPSQILDEGVPGLRIPIHDPSGEALRSFHEALRRVEAGEGKARAIVWGASHVASDWFVDVIRTELQKRFGDAGHGFVLPARPWRSYRHLGVDVQSSRRRWNAFRVRANDANIGAYGLAGVAVEADRRGAFGRVTTAERGTVGRAVSQYELWFLAQPRGGSVDVIIDGKKKARLSTRAPQARAAYARYEVDDGPHTFEIQHRGGGPVRIFGVVMERDEPGVVVDTLGINGSRARYQLLWEDALYREHLAKRNPDLVVLAYGTNEVGDDDVPIARYAGHVQRVVGRVREVVPHASCLLVGPTDRPIRDREAETVTDRPRTRQVVEVQRRVAEENGCGFFDLVAFMGGPMSMPTWVAHDPPFGAADHVHLTRHGYYRLGEVLFQALTEGYGPLPSSDAVLAGRAAANKGG